MKAISTKLLPVTIHKPARIKAYDSSNNSVIISADEGEYGWGDERTHRIAAEKLKQKMGWDGDLISGGTKEGWVFVFNK